MGALALGRAPSKLLECLYQERRLAHQRALAEREANRIVPHVIEHAPFRHEELIFSVIKLMQRDFSCSSGVNRHHASIRPSMFLMSGAEAKAEILTPAFGPGAEFALLAKSYRLAVATVGAACLSPFSATTTPTT